MAVLTRDAISAANDVVTEEVDVPEWGGTVMVRSITAAEQKEVTRTQTATNVPEVTRMAKGRLQLVVYGCVDKSGNQLFTVDDYDWLESKNPAVLNRIVGAVQRISGLTEEATEAAEGKATSG